MESRIKDLEVKMGRIGPWAEHEWWEMSYEVQSALLMLNRRDFLNKYLKFMVWREFMVMKLKLARISWSEISPYSVSTIYEYQ